MYRLGGFTHHRKKVRPTASGIPPSITQAEFVSDGGYRLVLDVRGSSFLAKNGLQEFLQRPFVASLGARFLRR